MDLLKKSCAFTGHRKMQEDFNKTILLEKIKWLIEKEKVFTFFCGMAQGFDLFACEIVVDLKKSYKDLKIIACIPCPEQQKFFTVKDRKKYLELLEKCDEIKIVSDKYFKGCMQVRNKFMVDRSDYVLAYLRENSGGTKYTVNYAIKSGKTVIGV